MDRSGSSVSVWTSSAELPRFGSLNRNLDADVCVIGGIAGLSVAYQLACASPSVVVLEDGSIGSGETSRTTTHLATAFDDRYAPRAVLGYAPSLSLRPAGAARG